MLARATTSNFPAGNWVCTVLGVQNACCVSQLAPVTMTLAPAGACIFACRQQGSERASAAPIKAAGSGWLCIRQTSSVYSMLSWQSCQASFAETWEDAELLSYNMQALHAKHCTAAAKVPRYGLAHI